MIKEELVPCCYNCKFWKTYGNNRGGCGQQYTTTKQISHFGPGLRIGDSEPDGVRRKVETSAMDLCRLFINEHTGDLLPFGYDLSKQPSPSEIGVPPCLSGRRLANGKMLVEWSDDPNLIGTVYDLYLRP